MYVKKRLNNNVVQVTDHQGNNLIVMGNGIGYLAYPGDRVKDSKIERTYVLKDDGESDIKKIAMMIDSVPLSVVYTCETILREAERHLEQAFSLSLLFSLADHVDSAIQRVAQGMAIVNPLHWDIKELYPEETAVGRRALEIIEQEQNVKLNKEEATAIALHFLAQRQSMQSIEQAQNFTEIISKMIAIIQYHFQVEIDQSSVNFSRFITHVQYFLIRQVKRQSSGFDDDHLMRLIIQSYQEEFTCSEKIMMYLKEVKQMEPTIGEQVYLTLHIRRLISSD